MCWCATGWFCASTTSVITSVATGFPSGQKTAGGNWEGCRCDLPPQQRVWWDEVWDQLPQEAQQQIIDKGIRFYVVDGDSIASEAGLKGRINTVLQTCFFGLSNVLPSDEAIAAIKAAIRKAYGKLGDGRSRTQQRSGRRRTCRALESEDRRPS